MVNTRSNADGFRGEYPKPLKVVQPATEVPIVDDGELFEWRDALLVHHSSPSVPHRVPLVNGRPPGEFDRPRADGGYDHYRLLRSDDECAVYVQVDSPDQR